MKPERETEIKCSPDHKQLTLNLKHVIIKSIMNGTGLKVKGQGSKSRIKSQGSRVKGQ